MLRTFSLLSFLLMLNFTMQAQTDDEQQEQSMLDSAQVSNAEISKALKLTLKKGVDQGTRKLKQTRGLFDLGSPDSDLGQVIEVIQTLNKLDKVDLVEELQKILNRSAAGIVNTSKPIFNQAIEQISFGDAYRILMRGENAATKFVKDETSPAIKAALQPKVEEILKNSGAEDVWTEILSIYNAATGENIDLNLAESITDDVVRKMFNQIAAEEVKMRLNDYLWTSAILKKVFALQIKMKR